MRKLSNNSIYILFTTLMIGATLLSGCKGKNQAQNVTYTCPMHPDIVKNEASTCPICGMDLVRLHQNKTSGNSKLNPTDAVVKEGIATNTKTIYPKSTTFRDTVTINGVISVNPNNIKTVSSYVSGRIEKLYVNYNNQKITKGQKIMDIYSPDLVAAQQELLYLKQNGDISLMNQAKNKLRLLGMTDKDINNTLSKGVVNYSISVYSPHSGFALNDDVNGTGGLNTSNAPLNLRQGIYINTGAPLFKVYTDANVWAEFSVNANLSVNLKPNQRIEITNIKNKLIDAKISSVQPFYKDGQNFSTVRVLLKNQDKLFRIGELVSSKIISDEISSLWIPKTAVYDAGGRTFVFIKKKKQLHPLSITAKRTGDKIMVLNGLSKTDEIAENAAHLVDPEAFINN